MEAILAASANKTMPSAYDQQIADLEALNEADGSDEEMAEDDSDAEEMKRIVAETKVYDNSDLEDEVMEEESVEAEPEILFVYRAKAGGSMFVELKRPQYSDNEDKSVYVSWFWSKPDCEPE